MACKHESMIPFEPLITKSKNYFRKIYTGQKKYVIIYSVNQNTEVSYMATRKKSSAKRQTKKGENGSR